MAIGWTSSLRETSPTMPWAVGKSSMVRSTSSAMAGDEGDAGAAVDELAHEAAAEAGGAAGDGDAQVFQAVVGHEISS